MTWGHPDIVDPAKEIFLSDAGDAGHHPLKMRVIFKGEAKKFAHEIWHLLPVTV